MSRVDRAKAELQERDQNYRKRALEGDADAAFFFARQDALLAGEADARFEAIEMDMSLFE